MKNSGQALLLVLLSLAVIVTISLSVVSRSISDINVTTKEEESLRAFSAAEAGVEEILVSPTFTSTDVTKTVSGTPAGEDEVEYKATISGFPDPTGEYVYPFEIASGDSATFWFMSHQDLNTLVCPTCYTGTGSLEICWGKPASSISPAVALGILYEDAQGRLQLYQEVVDSQGDSRTPGTSSNPPSLGCTISGQAFLFKKSLNLSTLGLPVGAGNAGKLKLLRVRMLYNTDQTQMIGVNTGSESLHAQGRKINSIGTAGDATRQVEVYEVYPSIPSIFDTALYSPSSIAK